MKTKDDSRVFWVHKRAGQIALLAKERQLSLACVAVLQALNWYSDIAGGTMHAANETIADRIGASRRTVVDAIRRLVTADLLVPTEPPHRKRAPVKYAFGPAICPDHPMNQPGHARHKAALRAAFAAVRKKTRRKAREAYREQLDGQNLHDQ